MFFIKKWFLQIAGKNVAKNVGLENDTEVNVDTKQWWKSKTIWAITIDFAIAIIKIAKPELLDTSVAITLITFLSAMGIYGRKSATTEIK